MTKPFNGIPDFRKKEKKEEETDLTFEPCCVCQKVISMGYYGRWGNGGTCSKKCELVKQDEFLYTKGEP
jgi:hypothetical protein